MRRPLSRQWIGDHPDAAIFGMKRSASSTDSAFSHNAAAELAHLLGEASLTVIMDLHKAFDSVLIEPLLEQARALNFPMRLACQCISYFRMPRLTAAGAVPSWPTAASWLDAPAVPRCSRCFSPGPPRA